MSKPNFMRIWNEFPDHMKYPTMKDLFTWQGGQAERNIYAEGFGPGGVNGNLKLTPFRDNRQSKFDPLDDIKSVN